MKRINLIKKFLNKINSKPYIIAEVGVNHEGSIKTAKNDLNGKERWSRRCKISNL